MAAQSVVVDSSVFIASVFQETYSTQARALIQLWSRQGLIIAVPYLFYYEIISVLRKHVARNTTSSATALQQRNLLLAHPIQAVFDFQLIQRAYDLAEQFNRPTAYDAQYLALAERLRCEFWTADEKLFNAVHPALPWVQWLGQVSSNE